MDDQNKADTDSQSLRERVHQIIFEHDTPAGKFFDVLLLIAIALSVLVVMLESVEPIKKSHGTELAVAEWVFTILFSLEYVLRLWCVDRPVRYARSFFGVIDLLSFLPTYLELIFAGSHYLTVVRVLRLLRVFRVLKMIRYMSEARVLLNALRASRPKIVVFLGTVITLVVIIGTLMYIVEGPRDGTGFTSIPQGVYWAIVTLTTVGYGDIIPLSAAGKMLSAIVMVLGWSIIAVPAGIVTMDIQIEAKRFRPGYQACRSCGFEGHSQGAKFCQDCGAELKAPDTDSGESG